VPVWGALFMKAGIGRRRGWVWCVAPRCDPLTTKKCGLTRSFVSTPMFTTAESTVAVLALVLLLSRRALLHRRSRAGRISERSHVGLCHEGAATDVAVAIALSPCRNRCIRPSRCYCFQEKSGEGWIEWFMPYILIPEVNGLLPSCRLILLLR
jgi:hypothetical protein